MLLKPTTAPAPKRDQQPRLERPHLLDLLLSLIDARVSHVGVMDTTWEAEVERYYRARQAAHRADRAGEETKQA